MTDSGSLHTGLKTGEEQQDVETQDTVDNLKSEVAYRTRLQEITNAIYAASSLDEILFDLKDEIVDLVGAERITVYYVDGIRRELVSRFKSGSEVSEIRLPVSKTSIAGFCASSQKMLNISDVYDTRELFDIDPNLGFDSSWDSKTGFKTKQVLVAPIVFKSFMLGVIQLINRREGGRFTEQDEENISELAKIMGIALYNQKKMAASRKNKFDYLLENHIMTRKELENAVAEAREKKVSIESYLIENLKIPKKDVLEALGRYYDIPWIEFRNDLAIPQELLRGLNVPFMKKNSWVPIRSENGNVLIAIDNPDDIKRVDEIKTLFPRKTIKLAIAVKADILEIIKLFTQNQGPQQSIDDILSRLQDEEEEIEEDTGSVDEQSGAVVQLVNKMILDAYSRGASDIHLEPYPGRQNTRVRVRVDGACAV
ncbi:MAG: GAF domain-containing protein, partial [Thermodesulfobacteriota bacterium]